MKRYLQSFKEFIAEAKDPSYYQETFNFTILISMHKESGGSRDETKNDIRALPEVLTVTLIEPERGGVQRDIGTKYLSTLKVHVRKPRNVDKRYLMKRLVLHINNLRGVTVLRYKERPTPPRRKPFRGSYKITEDKYKWQSSAHKADLKKDFKDLASAGPQKKGGAPFSRRTDPDWESAPPGAPGGLEEVALDEPLKSASDLPEDVVEAADPKPFDRLYEDILITIGDPSDNLMAFDIQPDLNQKLWDGDKGVRAGVKGALLAVVEEFLEGLDLDLNIEDIIVTGSIANYNWSKFSDIDIHIVLDFEMINDNREMVKKFFDAVRANWNKLHNIFVKGHEVEIYVQDMREPHFSTGVYSLENDQWLVKPKKVKPHIDKETATKKMKHIAREINKLSLLYDNKQYERSFELAERLKEKIKRMRRSGLEKTGIYSPENLAFKMLRRSGDIEQLFSIYTQAYDKIYSLDQ